jgi:hypothetical protein
MLAPCLGCPVAHLPGDPRHHPKETLAKYLPQAFQAGSWGLEQ